MNIYILDSETTRWNLIDDYIDLRLVEILNCENNSFFECTNQQELNNWLGILLESESTSRIYTHNLDFDAKFIFPWLETLDSTLYKTFLCKTSRLLEIQIYYIDNGKKRKQLSFRDSYALLPDKLEKIGEKLGYPKGEYSENLDELKIYCKRDCEIVKRALEQYVSSINELVFFENIKIKKYFEFSNLPLTTSAVMKKLMRSINADRWLRDYSYQQMEKLLRNFYFGGRTEIFNFNAIQEGYEYDFNSLYPSIFVDFELPSEDFKIVPNENNYTIQECFSAKSVIAIIVNVVENDDIPYFPSRYEGKTIFAKGEKQALMFREDYELVISKSLVAMQINEIDALIVGKQNDDLSSLYRTAYRIRQESPFPLPMKYLLNGGYGKYGERRTKVERLYLPVNQKNVLDTLEKLGICKLSNDRFIIAEGNFDSRFLENNILIACKITALARMKLYLMICEIGKHNSYYVDTDSIFSPSKLDDTFVSNAELGKMKNDFIIHDFQAYSPKEYELKFANKKTGEFETHYKIKGVKTENLEKDQEFNLLDYYIGNGIDFSRPAKISEIYRKNLDYNAVIISNKQKRTYYNKRIINDDLTTRPFDLNDNNDKMEFENKEKIIAILGIDKNGD
jgi:hypothetical protein